jgi:hypothetical protein
MRTIAVGMASTGKLFAASSRGFDPGQLAAANELEIEPVPGVRGLHAEENLLNSVPDLSRIGTSLRSPCGPEEHNCLQQLMDNGVEVEC